MFDRVFHLTRGGISKASKTINLSEDVYAGTKKQKVQVLLYLIKVFFHFAFVREN